MANWFDKILPSFIKKETAKKSSVPEGLWQACSACSTILYVPELEANLYVCTKCDHHIRIGARKRLDLPKAPLRELRKLAASPSCPEAGAI